MEGACTRRAGALSVAIAKGDQGDHDFIRDLGKRVAMTSVSQFRPAIGSLVNVAYEKLLDFVFAQSHVILIAREGGRRVGFLLLLDALPDEVSLSPQAFVAYMAVEPDARRRGIGRALLNAAEELARERGLPTMAMMVTESNDPALRLYSSAGYRTERRLLCKSLD
jgi:ribosomal protein S18 acetylase RimI-like enzyme